MTERNPYHKPAGSSEGGQFTTGQLGALEDAVNRGAGLQLRHKYGRIKPQAGGIFEGTYIPVIDDLSYNSTRERLATGALQAVQDLITRFPTLRDKIVGAILQGSFISDKEFPKDIDILLEFRDASSMLYFAKEVIPTIRFSYGRVEFGFWSKEHSVSVKMKDLYNLETTKRWGVSPIDISDWLEIK